MAWKDVTIQAVDDVMPQIARVGFWRFPQHMKERRSYSLSVLHIWFCKQPVKLSLSLLVGCLRQSREVDLNVDLVNCQFESQGGRILPRRDLALKNKKAGEVDQLRLVQAQISPVSDPPECAALFKGLLW